MKKSILLIVIVLATYLTKAQSHAALENYSFGRYLQYMENMTQMRDGNILTSTRLFNIDSLGPSSHYGYGFLKLDREDASVMDSLIMPVDYVGFCLLEPHPSGEGYILANRVYDFMTESCFMKIRYFDENLVFHDEEEVTVPLIDTVPGGMDVFALEEGSFIMMGSMMDGAHTFQRFGFDGTLMDRKVYPDSTCSYTESRNIKVWNEFPREYVFTGYNAYTSHCSYFVLDSLLDLKETIELNEHTPQYPNVWFKANANNKVERLDDSTYLLATKYEKENISHPLHKKGVQVTKRDKATHSNLKTVYFPLHIASNGNMAASPYVVDVKRTEEGYIYLAYGDLSGMNRCSVVLMDADLNVLWQQYYLNLGHGDGLYCMRILDDGGLGLVGFNVGNPRLFVLLISNDYEALEEQGITIRPYDYWPNPARDELRLRYSPDVQPKQIELYDLQGRLVRSQSAGLECLNMEGLAAGTYTMCVTLEGGMVFSDNVIKE